MTEQLVYLVITDDGAGKVISAHTRPTAAVATATLAIEDNAIVKPIHLSGSSSESTTGAYN